MQTIMCEGTAIARASEKPYAAHARMAADSAAPDEAPQDISPQHIPHAKDATRCAKAGRFVPSVRYLIPIYYTAAQTICQKIGI